MTTDRIIEIHKETAYPESRSVYQALLQVWNECEQDKNKLKSQKEQEAADKIRYLAENEDTEDAHIEADRILCELLTQLGYNKVVEEFEKMDKWYA